MRSSIACALALSLPAALAQYSLVDDYEPSNFASMFNFFTGADPTNGYVNYVDQNTAQSSGLYSTQNGSVYMGVDSTNVASGSGRNSVRIESKTSYNHGLIILDLEHMPGGQCGTWPAFWMYGPNWPTNGELDIIENVNSATTNSVAMHVSGTCDISNTGTMSGTIVTDNCDVNAAGQATNAGCAIDNSNTASYGNGFNAANGGVYAAEWTSQAINVYYFPRSAIPADITSGNPDPSGWGLAQASFTGGCDLDAHVDNMNIVFDTTFCGDWAGAVWSTDATCSTLASTCQSYVQNNPSAFVETYWLVNSLKVYQINGAVATSSATSSAISTATATSTSPSSTSTSTFVPTTTSSSLTSATTSFLASATTSSLTSATTTSTTSYSSSYTTPYTTSYSSTFSTSYYTTSSYSSYSSSTSTPYLTSTWTSYQSEWSSAWPTPTSESWSSDSWQGGSPTATQSWGGSNQGPGNWNGQPGNTGGNGGWW